MSETELKILYPDEKLDALRFFLSKKDSTIEQELRDYLEKSYEKFVPQQVRDYVENHAQTESAPQETPEEFSEPRQPRQYRRRQNAPESEPANVVSSVPVAPAVPEETESAGMSMNL